MKIGLIKPNFPNEKRVALLPQHIESFENELIIESGFGENLDIPDTAYMQKGCTILNRKQIYAECTAIFNLKLTQPDDYKYLRHNQMILGWTHPFGSGKDFFDTIAQEYSLKIIDLDNIVPRIFIGKETRPISFIEKNFIWKNSFNAGYAATQHALLSYGLVPDYRTKIAILAAGSVSQGAFYAISKYSADVRLFYRKTIEEFKRDIGSFDVIINGIEVENDTDHILTKQNLKDIRKGSLIIDAAADAGRAIFGTRYTSIAEPIYLEDGIYYYVVNNAPSLIYRKSSIDISESLSKWVFKIDAKRFDNIL